jgi:arylsulfatase
MFGNFLNVSTRSPITLPARATVQAPSCPDQRPGEVPNWPCTRGAAPLNTMYVAFMKCHNPNNPAPEFKGKSHLSSYLDAFMELDNNTGKIISAIKDLGIDNNTIVLWTSDNGPWVDAYPDAGFTPFRAMKGTTFEGAFRVPAFMWAPGRIQPGTVNNDIIGHIDAWPTLAALAGLTPPPHGEWQDNEGKPIYFDGIDQSARILGKSNRPPRMTWAYMRGLELQAIRYGEWKWNWSSQDAILGRESAPTAVAP